MKAVDEGSSNMVRHLLKKGAYDIDAQDEVLIKLLFHVKLSYKSEIDLSTGEPLL